jgi:transposase
VAVARQRRRARRTARRDLETDFDAWIALLQNFCQPPSINVSERSRTPHGAGHARNLLNELNDSTDTQGALLVAIWNIATTNTAYPDPGGDYFTCLNPQKARSNAVRELEAMGYYVTL